MRIAVFLGAPGSGKGTQAKRLVDHGSYVHVSTGDLLRASVKSGSASGQRAKTFMDRGELVPDAVIIELLQEHLRTVPSSTRAVLLDGFPRTLPQAEALDAVASLSVDRAVFFEVPQSLLIGRLTGRRTCEKCGTSFHIDSMQPSKAGVCDRCGGRLLQRSDDEESVVRKRLQVFERENERLLAHYRKDHRLASVDASGNVDTVFRAVEPLVRGTP